MKLVITGLLFLMIFGVVELSLVAVLLVLSAVTHVAAIT